VQACAEGKRQHVVEIANFVDAGTSIWLHREVRGDFDAEVILEVVAQFLCEHGLPQMLTFDHDPRLVGSPAGRDFPCALVRFLLCLGVQPTVIPPHRPDLNAYAPRGEPIFGESIRPLFVSSFHSVHDTSCFVDTSTVPGIYARSLGPTE
jgi:hypothetical protein